MDSIIIHVDMDAFYAAVEVRDDPSLRGKPLIIGSLPTERGVVATCSYEARKYGIHSGQNIKEAYLLCPKGIYRHPDFDKYRKVSHALHDIWNSYASAAEYIALDEAYLDVTEQAGDWEGARVIAHAIKERTKSELGLTCSVGLAYSKTAAKTASEEKKPDGYFEIRTAEQFVRLLADRDVRVLYTVGEKTAEKLHHAGFHTVRQITERPEEVRRLLGKQGQWIVQLASGNDHRKVEPWRPEDAKSISREITFQEDVNRTDLLDDVLFLLALCVEERARRVGLYGSGVVLKVTYGNMKKISRSRMVDSCESGILIYEEARKLMEHVERRPIRLIGLGIYNLSEEPFRQMTFEDLMEDRSTREQERYRQRMSALQDRYHLDFQAHLQEIYHGTTLHRTVEYMRKYIGN